MSTAGAAPSAWWDGLRGRSIAVAGGGWVRHACTSTRPAVDTWQPTKQRRATPRRFVPGAPRVCPLARPRGHCCSSSTASDSCCCDCRASALGDDSCGERNPARRFFALWPPPPPPPLPGSSTSSSRGRGCGVLPIAAAAPGPPSPTIVGWTTLFPKRESHSGTNKRPPEWKDGSAEAHPVRDSALSARLRAATLKTCLGCRRRRSRCVGPDRARRGGPTKRRAPLVWLGVAGERVGAEFRGRHFGTEGVRRVGAGAGCLLPRPPQQAAPTARAGVACRRQSARRRAMRARAVRRAAVAHGAMWRPRLSFCTPHFGGCPAAIHAPHKHLHEDDACKSTSPRARCDSRPSEGGASPLAFRPARQARRAAQSRTNRLRRRAVRVAAGNTTLAPGCTSLRPLLHEYLRRSLGRRTHVHTTLSVASVCASEGGRHSRL
eukprot:366103-Chlamydomonas_euryale.AAC.1